MKAKSIILSMFLAAIVMMMVVGCTKSDNNNSGSDDQETPKFGVFSPGKKIKKLTTYKEGSLKHHQLWNWNGDLLESIKEEYQAAEFSFSYDEFNRLIRVDVLYYDDRTDREIGGFLLDYFEDGVAVLRNNGSPIPDTVMMYFCQNEKISKGIVDDYIFNYYWSDDNLIRDTRNGHDEKTYEYDNQHNPFCGFMPFYFYEGREAFGISGIWSKNNAILVKHNGNIYYKYNYEYDSDGYPTSYVISEPAANGYDYDGQIVEIEYW